MIFFFHFLNDTIILLFNQNIMKAKYLFISLISIVLLSACAQPSIDETDNEDNIAVEDEGGNYLGSWNRTAVYLSGELQNTAYAKLTFTPEGTFNSLGECASSGTYKAMDEGTITMVMTRTNCPGNIPLPLTVTYTYTIDENEDETSEMTMYNGPSMETFVR